MRMEVHPVSACEGESLVVILLVFCLYVCLFCVCVYAIKKKMFLKHIDFSHGKETTLDTLDLTKFNVA